MTLPPIKAPDDYWTCSKPGCIARGQVKSGEPIPPICPACQSPTVPPKLVLSGNADKK